MKEDKPKRVRDMSMVEMEKLGEKLSSGYRTRGGRPLSRQERRALERVVRGRGRPQVGEGAQRVMVSIEKGLLARVDEYAREEGITRAQLVSRGLRMAMGEKKG